MYCKTVFSGGGGAAIIGTTTIKHCCDVANATKECDLSPTGMSHFVREAYVSFPGHGPGFWILNIIALIVGINTIIYAVLSLWKMRPRRQRPLIDPAYEANSPYGDALAFAVS